MLAGYGSELNVQREEMEKKWNSDVFAQWLLLAGCR